MANFTPAQVVVQGLSERIKSEAIGSLVENRIFYLQAPATADYPLVLVRYVWGMNDTSSSWDAFDMWFKVQVVSNNMMAADEGSTLLKNAIHQQDLPYPDPWGSEAPCYHVGQADEMINIQGTDFYALGGLYRFRAGNCK